MESRQAHEGRRWWWPEYERRQSFRDRQGGEYDPDYERHGRERHRDEETAGDWSRHGPYTGKGPRGYRRSDERIYENVCEWLMIDGRIDAGGIEVEVHNGEVTLNGTIADVGRVKEVRENGFTVDRRLEPDIGIDYRAVVDVRDRVYIDADVPDRLTRMGDFPHQ